MFFPGPFSLGQRRLRLTRQSDAGEPAFAAYRENARWQIGAITFATVHVVGTNNGFGRSSEGDAEWAARTAADAAWLRETFDLAARVRSRGVMIIQQANPWDPRAPEGTQAFDAVLQALVDGTAALQRPVALVHGDTHMFRIDKPLGFTRQQVAEGLTRGPVVEDFTRVETFGTPNVHWIKVSVDYADPSVFTFRQMLVR